MIEHMNLKVLKPNQLIFLDECKVYVIISGYILMKNHDHNIYLPNKCAKFSEGDILNFAQDKIYEFISLETWFFAEVESEIAVFP